jgi:hypothetical protein
LTTCYRGQGWKLERRRIVQDERKGESCNWQSLEGSFSKPDGSHGFLTATAFDDIGYPIELPVHSLIQDIVRAIKIGRRSTDLRPAFQVQVWVTAGRPIDESERQAAHGLLSYSRQRFLELIIDSSHVSSATLSSIPF